jgi:hypothetical protein
MDEPTKDGRNKIPDFTAPQLITMVMQLDDEVKRLLEVIKNQEGPKEFTCKCGYGGFEMTKTFVKCMKCGTVYH